MRASVPLSSWPIIGISGPPSSAIMTQQNWKNSNIHAAFLNPVLRRRSFFTINKETDPWKSQTTAGYPITFSFLLFRVRVRVLVLRPMLCKQAVIWGCNLILSETFENFFSGRPLSPMDLRFWEYLLNFPFWEPLFRLLGGSRRLRSWVPLQICAFGSHVLWLEITEPVYLLEPLGNS